MIKSHRQTVYETLGRHPIHPFPARMAPGIALDALQEHGRPIRVLDPMMGSGTVLAVARSQGHQAFGIDTDPLAVLLSKVWTTTVDYQAVITTGRNVLARAKTQFHVIATSEAYPPSSDNETKAFVRYWFDEYARRQLTALTFAISAVGDDRTRDVLWCAFSRLIISKQSGASRAMDLSHSRPHRVFKRAPSKPFNKFLEAVNTVAKNCPQTGRGPVGPIATAVHGDARKIALPNRSIDLVLTSPPYLNAIDYIRCSKFSLVWMGHSVTNLREIRRDNIGTEMSSLVARTDQRVQEIIHSLKLRPSLNNHDYALLCQYVHDMRLAVNEVSRVLAPGGRAVYVVGDSTVKGTFIRNSAIVTAVAERAGLRLHDRRTRYLPPNRRYLPPPTSGAEAKTIKSRMRREVVLAFRRAA